MSEGSIEGPIGDRPEPRGSEETVTPGVPSFEGEHGERADSGRTAGMHEGRENRSEERAWDEPVE